MPVTVSQTLLHNLCDRKEYTFLVSYFIDGSVEAQKEWGVA